MAMYFINKNKIKNIERSQERTKSDIFSKISKERDSTKTFNQSLENRIAKNEKESQKLSQIEERVDNVARSVKEINQNSSRSYSASSAQNYPTNNRSAHNTFSHQSLSENASSEPKYIVAYNNRNQSFQHDYDITSVGREEENYKLSRSLKTTDVVLDSQRQGNYWLFSNNDKIFVVPKHTFKIREDDVNDVRALFDCINYQAGNASNFSLIEPALVIQQKDGTWELRDKGKLQFG